MALMAPIGANWRHRGANGANLWRQLATSPIGDVQVSENSVAQFNFRQCNGANLATDLKFPFTNLSLYSLCVLAHVRASPIFFLCILSVALASTATDCSLQREYRERFITVLHYQLEFYY